MPDMNKTADRAVDALARIANALEAIAANMGDGTTAPAEDPKPEPKKASKPKADPKPKPEPKKEPEVEEKTEEATEVSAQDLRAKLIEVMQKVDKPSAVAIVDKFAGKGGKMGDIPDDKRAEAFAEAKELLSL